MSLSVPPESSKCKTTKSSSSKIVPNDHDQSENKGENYQAKISSSSPQGVLKKRSALEDVTNAQLKKEANKEFVKDISKKTNRDISTLGLAGNNEMNMKKYKLDPSQVAVSTTMVSNTVEKPLLLEISTISETPTTEEASFFKKPLGLKEEPTNGDAVLTKKHTNQGEASLLEKPLSLQKETDSNAEFVVEPVTLVEKHEIEKAAITKRKLSSKKQSCQQEEVLLQDSAEEHSFMEPMNVMKKPKTEEAVFPKKQLPLKKKHATQGKRSHKKQPLVFQKTTSGEKCHMKESLSSEKKPTTEESLFQEPSLLQEKHTTQGKMVPLNNPLEFLENIDSKGEFVMDPVSFRKKDIPSEAASTMEPLSLKENKPIVPIMTSTCQELVALKTMIGQEDSLVMEPVSLKKSSTEGATPTETSFSPKNKETQGKKSPLNEPLVLERSTSEEESLKKPLPYMKPSTNEGSLFQDPSVLKEKHTTLQEASLSEKPLVLQETTTTEEESYIKKPLEEKPTTVKEFLPQEPFSWHVEPTDNNELPFWEGLYLPEMTDIEEDTLKQLLDLQDEDTTEEKPLFEQQLALQESMMKEEEWLLKQRLTFQKPDREKALFEVPLPFQGQPTISEAFSFKGILPSSGKPTTGQEMSTHKEDTLLKNFSFQVKTSPYMSSTGTVSRKASSSNATVSSLSKLSTSTSSACASSSNTLSSSEDKTSENERPSQADVENYQNYQFFKTEYAEDIFIYMKQREEKFILQNYMKWQNEINGDMRAILVDWLIEVQMTFGMGHETLYLTVKLVDHYLMKVTCKRDRLQLIGSTAFLIASKFEEPYPPSLDDFLYICDDTYQRKEMLVMEVSILQNLQYDINIPVAYHFLRRYAVYLCANMNTLTLSRYICELTLLELDCVPEKASKLAAGCFLLALYMKKLGHWAPTLQHHSGYKSSDLHPLVKQLNNMLISQPGKRLKTVFTKYSQKIFFEVSQIPPVDPLELEKIVNSPQFGD